MFNKSKQKDEKITELDLGFKDDAITAIIDLLHIEIHSFKSWAQTKDRTWLYINNQARKQRTELLELICDKEKIKSDGELWCYNKHSLRVVGSYIELGNRELTKQNVEQAGHYFDMANTWLGIFLLKNNIQGGKNA